MSVNKISTQLSLLHHILSKKYSSGEFSYNTIQLNYLLCNEKCRVVAEFKDYLVLDDNTEFFRRYYNSEESKPRLKNILNFYETYSKIFPNYMILPENEYLYRNIRKKQKMIDAFNQIKKEEEDNRKNLNIGKKSSNRNRNIVFDNKVKQSISNYKPSELNENNSISISLMSRKPTSTNILSSSFTMEDSLSSIAVIVNGMTDEKKKETPKKNNQNNKNKEHMIQTAINNNRKFISHKATVSVPELNNKSIKIINNYHNIIIPQGAVVNINTNYYQCDKKSSSKPLHTIATSKLRKTSGNKSKVNASKNKMLTYSNRKKESSISSTAFKSPEKFTELSSSKTKNIAATISSVKHVMPIYKNKFNKVTEFNNKVNPLAKKIENKKLNKKEEMSKSKTEFVSSFTAHHHNTLSNVRKEVKVTLLTEANETKHKETHLMKKSINAKSNVSLNSHRNLSKKIGMSPKIISFAMFDKPPLTAKIKLSNKSPLNREMLNRISNQSKIIKSINFKGMDTNTKKMKFIKK